MIIHLLALSRRKESLSRTVEKNVKELINFELGTFIGSAEKSIVSKIFIVQFGFKILVENIVL